MAKTFNRERKRQQIELRDKNRKVTKKGCNKRFKGIRNRRSSGKRGKKLIFQNK